MTLILKLNDPKLEVPKSSENNYGLKQQTEIFKWTTIFPPIVSSFGILVLGQANTPMLNYLLNIRATITTKLFLLNFKYTHYEQSPN